MQNIQDGNEDGEELIILRGTTRRISSPSPSLSLPPASSLFGRTPNIRPSPTSDLGSSLSRSVGQSSSAQGSQGYISNRFGGPQQMSSNFGTAQAYNPKVQFPSGLGSASRNPQRAREWMAAVERNRAAVFAEQLAEQQKQSQSFSAQPRPVWMESTATSSGEYNPDLSTHMDFSTQDSFSGFNGKATYGAALGHSVEHGLHPFASFDFTLDPPSIIPGPFDRVPSTSQNATDFNGGLPGEDTASTVAWHSFMQEFDLTRDVSMDFENWEAMSSFA